MYDVLAPAQRRDYTLRNMLDEILATEYDTETQAHLMLDAGAPTEVVVRLLKNTDS
jgi:hypothetical protein